MNGLVALYSFKEANGTIQVTSQLGRGSTFSFTLPRHTT
jgi:signal transduction histidine kinase